MPVKKHDKIRTATIELPGEEKQSIRAKIREVEVRIKSEIKAKIENSSGTGEIKGYNDLHTFLSSLVRYALQELVLMARKWFQWLLFLQ